MKLKIILGAFIAILIIWNYAFENTEKIEIMAVSPEDLPNPSSGLTISGKNSNLFYWSSMPLRYGYSDKCPLVRINRIKYALNEIEKFTEGRVYFFEVQKNAEIFFNCFDESKLNLEDKTRTLGEIEIEYSLENNEIVHANIYFYDKIKEGCDYPDVEIHEILHALGERHNSYVGSVMNSLQSACLNNIDMNIDKNIFEKFKENY